MSTQVTVAVDANGADQGPREVAQGAATAASEDLRVRLFGDPEELGDLPAQVEAVHAPLSIAKEADPARAVRRSDDASIVLAAKSVAGGDADALVCGGSTGAALAAGLLHVGRAPGIRRPALALPVPIPNAPFLLLDAGANTDATAEHLVQFAFMGAAFSRAALGVDAPRVGLLSNGEESVRGTEAIVAANERLASAPGIDFVGNVEGTSITAGAADVVVADGFTGNVTLKVMEGMVTMLLGALRDAATASPRGKAGGALLRPSLRGLRDELDPERVGGAYLLGLKRVAVIYHGRFSSRGIASAIDVAARAVREDVVARTDAALEQAGALRDSDRTVGSAR